MRTVLIYTYYETLTSQFNLAVFLNHGVGSHMDYVFVINGRRCSLRIPAAPNIRVIARHNKGYDTGGHASALRLLDLAEDVYDYYFFMNSSVAGPFVSPSVDWRMPFINRINTSVKLVGTTIVVLPPTDAGGLGPRVEGFFFVTDKIGLDLLRAEGTIFNDHLTKKDAIVDGEYGASRCILGHGYSIDCMIPEYEGRDWRDVANWRANGNRHPSRQGSFRGKSLDPAVVIFHKWFWSEEPKRLVAPGHVRRFLAHTGDDKSRELARRGGSFMDFVTSYVGQSVRGRVTVAR